MIKTIEKKNLWILEDDQMIVWIYREILSPIYDISIFTTMREIEAALETMPKPHLIISDLQLPDGNFIDLVKNKFSENTKIPYIIISGDINIESLKFCLNKGAADYLTKPFNINELLVKIERFLHQYIDPHHEKLKQLNEDFMKTVLTYKESKILSTLIRGMSDFVTRKEIIENIWQGRDDINPKTLDVHLYNLRRKLKPLGFHINSDCNHRLQLS